MRRQFTSQQKATVALAALKGDKTINQVATRYEVHPTQVKHWRDAAKDIIPEAFADKRKKSFGVKTPKGARTMEVLLSVCWSLYNRDQNNFLPAPHALSYTN